MIISTLALIALISSAAASPFHSPPSTIVDASKRDHAGWTWAKTTQWFSFGDSYTTTAQNVTDGTLRPHVGTTSNGLVWIQWLLETYAVHPNINLWNAAWSAAVVDNTLLTPVHGGIPSIIEQVDQFEDWAGKHAGEWDQSTSICSMWIGINDIGFTYRWTNISIPDFYDLEHERIHTQLERLQTLGACSAYLLFSIPPLSLAPLYLAQGPPATDQVDAAVSLWNTKLHASASKFQAEVGDSAWVGVYETGPVFEALIDNAPALGYTNVTGFSTSYPILWGGPYQPPLNNNTQVERLLPQGSYFWLDNLHPNWAVHGVLAHAVGTFLGGVNVVGGQ